MNAHQIKRLEQTRQQGALRFVMIYGVSHGTVVYAYRYFMPVLFGSQRFVSGEALDALVAAAMDGLMFGVMFWLLIGWMLRKAKARNSA
jgi:hypothetical protein